MIHCFNIWDLSSKSSVHASIVTDTMNDKLQCLQSNRKQTTHQLNGEWGLISS